ncbi:MAG TPA: serine/threonine protein kinase [Ruminiclostridium sp.]|nr:serine/threonine protein kinase [Ruminiclostridium sp.]
MRDRYWALKFIPSREKFAENELEILKNLNHPVFPRLVDCIREPDYTILVYDYYEGPTLKKQIEQNGRIEQDRVCRWAIQILDALSYMHAYVPEPVIYRDLKPSNLIVLPDESIKLIDFGSARLYKSGGSDDTVYLGTPGYAAPEQYGFGQTDERTDIYNFGMTLFHLLTGKHPLNIETEMTGKELDAAGVSNKLKQIILKCIEADPDHRYANTYDVKEAFNRIGLKPVRNGKLAAIGKNAVEVSVSGIQKGAGVTHFCFMFGIWLQNHGFKTAVIEYCQNRDLLALCKLIGKDNIYAKYGYYRIQGLSVFPSMDQEKIDSFCRADFDYIIIDYGIYDEYVAQMLRRSDVKLVIAPGADWKMPQVRFFMDKFGNIFDDRNTFMLFPMQDRRSINVIKSYFRFRNIITVPYASNPWKQDNKLKSEIEKLYSRLFQTEISALRRKNEWHF